MTVNHQSKAAVGARNVMRLRPNANAQLCEKVRLYGAGPYYPYYCPGYDGYLRGLAKFPLPPKTAN